MKVTIYSKSGCPYCMMAKTWFDNNHIKYQEIVLDDINARKAFYEKFNGTISTVPQIFLNEELIGGYTDLKAKESYVKSKFL